ncbi:MAG TPA: deoxyribodipyrimidine photo-lyase [Dissulfurispiraceae bacterium]|nr:deoxyribodipyrimidine photo-lyase [Dissulfurispiraceae bacterium]
MLRQHRIEALYLNRSHSFATRKLDADIARYCLEHSVAVHEFQDALLVSPEAIAPKKIFTPFYKHWSAAEKQKPLPSIRRLRGLSVQGESTHSVISRYHSGETTWSAEGWKQRLKLFDVCTYRDTRNMPAVDGTSKLSPYLRFGQISIRQLYARMLKKADSSCMAETFISELAWCEFWYHIMHHFPDARTLEFQEKRRGLSWRSDRALFDAWREGRTGYPIVDAGMRQLTQEGWMHGRARMIVASFLTKDLLIDWRQGENHFADSLYDYDENVNIGNWQWSASVGADPRPLRIFSPVLQSQRFDPYALYIKRYIPELKNEVPARIHNPLKYRLAYYEPVVDHREMSRRARLFYAGK